MTGLQRTVRELPPRQPVLLPRGGLHWRWCHRFGRSRFFFCFAFVVAGSDGIWQRGRRAAAAADLLVAWPARGRRPARCSCSSGDGEAPQVCQALDHNNQCDLGRHTTERQEHLLVSDQSTKPSSSSSSSSTEDFSCCFLRALGAAEVAAPVGATNASIIA